MNYPQNVYDPSERFILEAKAFLQHFPKCCDISMTHRLDYKSLKYDSAEFQQNSKKSPFEDVSPVLLSVSLQFPLVRPLHMPHSRSPTPLLCVSICDFRLTPL